MFEAVNKMKKNKKGTENRFLILPTFNASIPSFLFDVLALQIGFFFFSLSYHKPQITNIIMKLIINYTTKGKQFIFLFFWKKKNLRGENGGEA